MCLDLQITSTLCQNRLYIMGMHFMKLKNNFYLREIIFYSPILNEDFW